MQTNALASLVADISTDPETLAAFAGDDGGTAVEPGPACVIRPANTSEVVAAVQWAIANGAGLTPVSSPGGPRLRGDSVPRAGGVAMDLSRMDRILRIDRRDRIAVIEPGVTFAQLEPALRSHGLRALKPLLPRPRKSVIASCLEREPPVIPREHWDAMDPLVCVEAVLGTGEVVRTGSAGGPGSPEQQWDRGMRHVNPAGPGAASLARVLQGAQGTLGIVTWASIACSVWPSRQKALFIGARELEALIEPGYELLHRRIGEELFVLNGVALARMLGGSPDAVAALAETLPAWLLVVNLAGFDYAPAERIAYQEADAGEIAAGAGLRAQERVAGVGAATLLERQQQGSDRCYKHDERSACRELVLVSTLDRMPRLLAGALAAAESAGCPGANVGIYLQPTVQGCNCHAELCFGYDPAREGQRAGAQAAAQAAETALLEAGAFFNRPYGALAQQVYARDPAGVDALRKVKAMLDPAGVLNPGKLCFQEPHS